MHSFPIDEEEVRTEVVMGVILTLVTCGIYGLFWQYKQMKAVNAWLETPKYNFWMYVGLSIVTCGIYAIYTEYIMAKDINEIQHRYGLMVNQDLAMICLLLSIFGLSIVSLAIQQNEINRWYQSL